MFENIVWIFYGLLMVNYFVTIVRQIIVKTEIGDLENYFFGL